MAFWTSTLSNAQYKSLRGDFTTNPVTEPHYAADYYVGFCDNTSVLECRVNGAVSGSVPFAQFFYDTVTVGATADVDYDMVCIVSPTNDKRDPSAKRYRIRALPTGTTNGIININETSDSIADNAYVFVLNAYDLTDRLAKPASATVQYKDFNVAYIAPAPVVVGLQTVYAGFVSSGTGNKLQIAFDISNSFPVNAAATSTITYLWTFPTGATITVNTSTDPNPTVRFDPGEYWCKVVITDSVGTTWRRRFLVKSYDTSSYQPTAIVADSISINNSLDAGYTASCTAYSGVSTLLNQSLTFMWRVPYYNRTAETPIGNNILFVGYLSQENNSGRGDEIVSFEKSVSFEIVGIAARLQKLEAQLLALRDNSAPDEWDELQTLTNWRGVAHFFQRHTTALNLCDLDVDSATDGATFRFPYLSTQGGNALAAANGMLAQTNAALEFAPDGRMQITRHAAHLDSSQRSALLAHANWTNVDLLDIEETRAHIDDEGKLDADGAWWDGSTTTAYRSRAPGHAQSSGSTAVSLNNQILAYNSGAFTASAELDQRAGNELAIKFGEKDVLTITHPDGYEWLIPTRGVLYTWTLDGSENVRGIVYTTETKWMCVATSKQYDNEAGGVTFKATYLKLPAIADPGQNIPQVAEGEIAFALPDVPFVSFDGLDLEDFPYPDAGWLVPEIPPGFDPTPKGRIAPVNGNAVMIGSTTQLWVTKTYIAYKSPIWNEVTPVLGGAYVIKHAIFDPFYTSTAIGAYLLATDGTNSKVFYTSNVFAPVPTWTEGTAYAGTYSIIRAKSTAGSVAIYSVSSTVGTSVSPSYSSGGSGPATINVGDTFNLTLGAFAGPWYSYNAQMDLSVCATFTLISINGLTAGGDGATQTMVGWIPCGGSQQFGYMTDYSEIPSGQSVTEFGLNSTTAGSVTLHLDSIDSGTGDSTVRVSTDSGATFGGAITVGTTPGSLGGFDTLHVGATSLAAADQQVKIATTFGGAYSNEANGAVASSEPTLLLIPWYEFGSTSTLQNNSSAPQYLLGASAAVGGEYLWRVTGSGKTGITPASASSPAGPNAAMTWKGTRGGVLMTKSGATHLFTTANLGGSPPTWTDRGAFGNAKYLRGRYKSATGVQLFFSGLSGFLRYSGNFGANTYTRTSPTSSEILFIEPLG